MSDDPESKRITELIDCVSHDRASESEREELMLYTDDDPELASRLERETRTAQLGDGWLDRVEADQRLQARESSRFVKTERAVGLGLVGTGVALGFVGTALSPIALVAGAGLLTWSFARVRLQTYKDDPYKDIKQ